MASDRATGTSADGPRGDELDVLIVCTANRCRSPIAAALLRRQLRAADGVRARSAGLLPGGGPVPPRGLKLMGRKGIDLATHVSRQLRPADLDRADLVLTMTRQQVREIVDTSPAAWPRCFTLKDFVRRGEQAIEPGDDLAGLLGRIGRDRGPETIMGTSGPDEVTDPMGRSRAVWRAVGAELEDQAGRLAALLARLRTGGPPATGHPAPPPR